MQGKYAAQGQYQYDEDGQCPRKVSIMPRGSVSVMKMGSVHAR